MTEKMFVVGPVVERGGRSCREGGASTGESELQPGRTVT
jgi:hypothetical protein